MPARATVTNRVLGVPKGRPSFQSRNIALFSCRPAQDRRQKSTQGVCIMRCGLTVSLLASAV